MWYPSGRFTHISGDQKIATQLLTLIEENQNADNIAEIARGTNSRDRNIVIQTLGTAHTAMGSGQPHGLPVDSPVQLHLTMVTPVVAVEGRQILDEGELVFDI